MTVLNDVQKITETLYGLKVGDEVQFIGDETRHVKELIGKIGSIVVIEPRGGQFQVKFDDITYNVSFSRQDLLLIENSTKQEVEFNGMLIDVENLTIEEMRSYLNKYHNFKEGIDFAVTDRVNADKNYKEVYLTNESYVEFMKDLFVIEKTRSKLTNESLKDFKETFRTTVGDGNDISVSFKVSGWTFRTHILGWQIQKYLCYYFDLDLMQEMGFQNVR